MNNFEFHEWHGCKAVHPSRPESRLPSPFCLGGGVLNLIDSAHAAHERCNYACLLLFLLQFSTTYCLLLWTIRHCAIAVICWGILFIQWRSSKLFFFFRVSWWVHWMWDCELEIVVVLESLVECHKLTMLSHLGLGRSPIYPIPDTSGDGVLFYCFITSQCTLVHMRGLGIACRPSVRLSVTLVDCDHISWKSWKLIARTISPTPSLFVAKRRSAYSQGNMGKFGGD